MKSLKITLLLSILFLTCQFSIAQQDQPITLIVSGTGMSKEDAVKNALRSSIEQAFGTFISTKTEILNDNLVKDEIVSISNGNIVGYEIISETVIPSGEFATSLKATVSVSKLISFTESKGFETEFKGSLFGANLKQQKLNEESELKSILHLCEISNNILSKSLDYSIEVNEPIKAQSMRSFEPKPNEYQVLITVKIVPNKNFDEFLKYFENTIKAIAMTQSEKDKYTTLQKKIYKLTINENSYLYFRNPKSVVALQNLFMKSNRYLHNFVVKSNIDTALVRTCCHSYNSNLATQNFYYDYHKPEIWSINTQSKTYSSDGSQNNNSGFPNFVFNSYYGEVTSYKVYFENLLWLKSNSVLFDSVTYFSADGVHYKQFGNPAHSSFPNSNVSYPLNDYGLIHYENIGKLRLDKKIYFCNYLAIYTEEELSKITNFKVEQLQK